MKRLADELEKANNLNQTPYASAGTYASDPGNRPESGLQGFLQTVGHIIEQMPTPRDQFGNALGSGYPFQPQPLDVAYDPATGRALPRLWQQPPAWNLEISYQRLQWDALWSVATQVDLVSRGIVIKIDELSKLEWSFVVADSTIEAIMAERNCSHSKAAAIAREKYQDEIARVTNLWENPYPEQGRSMTEWLTEFLWNHFTCDGVPVYPRYNLGRECIGFELLDPATIKCLLNDRGARPTPPAPAFQQILYSFPRGDYQAAAEADAEFFLGAGANNPYLRDQLAYFVRMRRTRSPYGFSVVEQCVSAATLYTERRKWLRDEYTHGVIPSMVLETDSEKLTNIEPNKLAGYERLLNGQLEGQSQVRRGAKVLPPGLHGIFPPTVDEKFKTDYDNHLIVMLAAIIGVSPSAFGVIPRSGLGGAGERMGEMQAALTMSQKPLEMFVGDSIDTCNRRFMGVDKNIRFQFNDSDDNSNSFKDKAQGFQLSMYSGQLTLNDVRDELGMPPYPIPEADEPMIVGATGVPTFLRDLLEVNEGGEVTGVKKPTGGNSEAQDGQGQSTEGEEGQGDGTPNGTSQAPPSGLEQQKKDEMKAFGNWCRSRTRLGDWAEKGDFAFKTLDADEAEAMNLLARKRAGVLSLTS